MPKELKNITDNVMSQIKQGRLKMRPRIYFVIGSILTLTGRIISILTSIFLVGLIRFSLRSHGWAGEYRLEQLISSFPWWLSGLAILSLILGIWLLRRYDLSYKIDFKLMVLGFIIGIIMAGWLIDATGLNEVWLRRGPMRGMMKYLQQNDIQQGGMP